MLLDQLLVEEEEQAGKAAVFFFFALMSQTGTQSFVTRLVSYRMYGVLLEPESAGGDPCCFQVDRHGKVCSMCSGPAWECR